MYSLLTRDLREALREEDGEEQEEEQEEQEQEEREIDSMGILGLSNKLYKDTRYHCKNHYCFINFLLTVEGKRKMIVFCQSLTKITIQQTKGLHNCVTKLLWDMD